MQYFYVKNRKYLFFLKSLIFSLFLKKKINPFSKHCMSRKDQFFANDVYFTLYVKAVPTARAPNKLINWTNYWLH